MQYTKPMIDLVYEIRRRVDADMKPSVKMANPDLLVELAEYHHQTKNTITKALIKELLFLAGGEWPLLLEPAKTEPVKSQEIHKQVVKVYRGQIILEDAPPITSTSVDDTTNQDASGGGLLDGLLTNNKPTAHNKPMRMYRGQPVY